ncbi:MAG: hypothetical protein K2X27_22275, partial [Candidatus Obscuribacterales bacterium]|nr:hypothetical protein [Candidatus Obscuribacterales bacterium]
MVEQTRTQLFMMLVQQAGAGALPLGKLKAEEFLPFFRKVEERVIYQSISPVLVYWSTRDAKWLLPESSKFRTLSRDAFSISIFSEDRSDKQDEFCFLVHSQGISMVVYGHCSDEHSDVYQCVGSIDQHIVKKAFDQMSTVLQFIDLSESNRLEDARQAVGNPVTAPHFVSQIRQDWPVLKQRNLANQPAKDLVLPGQETEFPKSAVEINEDTAILVGSAVKELSNLPPAPPPKPIAIQMPAKSKPQAKVEPPAEQAAEIISKIQPQATPKERIFGDPSLLDEEPFNFHGLEGSFSPPEERHESETKGKNGGNGTGFLSPGKNKEGIKNLRENLRDAAWTNITQEVRTVFAPDAQRIIRDIVSQLRISGDLPAILQLATEELTKLSR